CINTEHLYGGTGNGNFLVGDMDEFGKVYMSTVGCGIVYGSLAGSTPATPVTDMTVWGDADESGEVDILDVITVNKALLGKEELSAQGLKNADLDQSGKPDATDSLNIMKYIVGLLKESDFPLKK
ncbi:MAG: 1,4-beta-glucanase, partial [Ruminococcus sp.]|nr:1,4-beta-glucanase [Ruminococcus sp.]